MGVAPPERTPGKQYSGFEPHSAADYSCGPNSAGGPTAASPDVPGLDMSNVELALSPERVGPLSFERRRNVIAQKLQEL